MYFYVTYLADITKDAYANGIWVKKRQPWYI